MSGTDLRRREGADNPLRVRALFDMPLEKLGLIDRQLLRMERSLSGEQLPSATPCHVWDAALAEDTLLSNAYTSRLRIIMVNSGE